MKIGIIGSGNIGGTLAKLFVKAGYQVAISNSRGPESMNDLVNELGKNACAMTVNDAAKYGDVVVLASPWIKTEALPDPAQVAGKIVIDAMNPYNSDFTVIDLGNSTSSEETAKRLPGAIIVKAFNTIWFKHLAENGNTSLPESERQSIFIAGDSDSAKRTVSELIRAIGFAPVNTGNLHEGSAFTQPNGLLYAKEFKGGEATEYLHQIKTASPAQ